VRTYHELQPRGLHIKTTADGSRLSVKQAPLFLQNMIQTWTSPEGSRCTIDERQAMGVSCAEDLFPKREP